MSQPELVLPYGVMLKLEVGIVLQSGGLAPNVVHAIIIYNIPNLNLDPIWVFKLTNTYSLYSLATKF